MAAADPAPATGPHLEIAWHMRPRAMARMRTRQGQAGFITAECLEAQAQVSLVCAPWRGSYPKGVLVAVELEFRCVRHPWRGDLDNLEKLVMDALRDVRLGKLRDGTVLMGAGVYHDDRQVKRKVAEEVRVATPADEGVRLRMYPHQLKEA